MTGPAWGEGPSAQPPRTPLGPRIEQIDPPTITQPASPVRQEEQPRADGAGIAAIVVGCIGVFALGIVAAIVTAMLAAESGRRQRERGGTQRFAAWGMALALLDAVFWLVVHILFDVSFLLG